MVIDYEEFKVDKPKNTKPLGTYVSYDEAVDDYGLRLSRNRVEQLVSKKAPFVRKNKNKFRNQQNEVDVGHYDVRKAEYMRSIGQMNYLYISQYLADRQLAKLMLELEQIGTEQSWYMFFKQDLFKSNDNPMFLSEKILAWIDWSIKLARSRKMKKYFINVDNEDITQPYLHYKQVSRNRYMAFGQPFDEDDLFYIGEVKLQRIKDAS